MSEDTQEMPQSRNTAFLRHLKKAEEQIMTANATDAIIDAWTKKKCKNVTGFEWSVGKLLGDVKIKK